MTSVAWTLSLQLDSSLLLHTVVDKQVHQWFPLVLIALLGHGTLYAKIGFSMAKVTLEF